MKIIKKFHLNEDDSVQQEKPKRSAWNKGLTKETSSIIANAQKKKEQTNIAKYGVSNVFQSDEVKQKLDQQRHSGELAAKAMATKELKYGDKNYNNMSQNKATKLAKYGDENYNNRDKAKETSLQLYGTGHPNKNKAQAQKISQSRILNKSQDKAWETIKQKYGSIENYFQQMHDKMQIAGTLGNRESNDEKVFYEELCKKYGKQDIIKQYFDKDRYPFKCDFYIKSEDKFIELHHYYMHGPHPFDENNPEDIKALDLLKQIDKSWAKSYIYTWTDLDVRKLKTAQKNNLNFEAIYKK